MAQWYEDPFEDMSDEQMVDVLADKATDYIHTCEKCADLVDAVSDTGMCWLIGGLWEGYFAWLELCQLSPLVRAGRWRNDSEKV